MAPFPGVTDVNLVRLSDPKKLDLLVCDTGPGIDEGLEQRVFDPFFTTKEVGAGTGLGLSIAYGIVKEHGGTISVVSGGGDGATFVVQLPLPTEPAKPAR